MSIIYFNIEKWKKSKRKAVEGEGTTDEEIALSVISNSTFPSFQKAGMLEKSSVIS